MTGAHSKHRGRRSAITARMTRLLAAIALGVLAGCPHGGDVPTGPRESAADVVTKLGAARDARTGFVGESVMDYWLGKDRVKTSVLVMGQTGAKVRFNGLSPAGGEVLVDLACDGSGFKLLDKQHNCELLGPCDRQTIAELLHIELAPDDFLHLALGTPPMMTNPTGKVTWDGDKGLERVELTAAEGTQKLAIDTRDGHWDVVSSELVGPDGKTVWAVENADFHEVDDDATHGKQRVPGRSRFKSPREQADVLVEWKELKVNPTIDAAKFSLELPAGLPACHGTMPGPGTTTP